MQKKYIKKLFTRVLLSIILFLISSIYINYSDNNLLIYKKYLYNKTFNFAYANNLYDKYLGGVLPFENVYKEQVVSSEVVNFSNRKSYLDGVSVSLDSSTLVKTFSSGIIVYLGEKEGFNKTIIVQGSDGIDYWYGNLENINVTLYDYVETDVILGNPIDGKLYLKFVKNGEVLNYEEFI